MPSSEPMDWPMPAQFNWTLLIGAINELFEEDINNNTYIVGFSLGAQVAGMAGYHLSGYLGRITGTFKKQIYGWHSM